MCHGRNQLHKLGIIHYRGMVDVSWYKLHTLGIIYTIGVWLMCHGRNQLHTLGIIYTIGVWLMCRGRNQLHTLGIIHYRSMVDVS